MTSSSHSPHRIPAVRSSLLATLFVILCSGTLAAQDAVFTIRAGGGNSKTSGKVTGMDPEGVTIDNKKIPSEKIRRVTVGKEPTGVSRARDQMESGRFADCLEELKKIKNGNNNPYLAQELAFMEAYSTAQICLLGGNIPADTAGRTVRTFIDAHPNSYHLYPAIEVYGQLIFAFGKPDLAAREFAKLQSVGWTEYQLRGNFEYARMMELTDNLAEAQKGYQAILATTETDDLSQTYRLLAEVEMTKVAGLAGDPAASLQKLDQMIQEQDADNGLLFGHLYNAKGAVQEKAGKLKEARLAYMHTQLLYSSEPNPHAEALYRLARLLPQLKKTDEANKMRELIKSRYRNSYWSKTL